MKWHVIGSIDNGGVVSEWYKTEKEAKAAIEYLKWYANHYKKDLR